jgi:hypothetical protein
MGWDRGIHEKDTRTESEQFAFFEQCYERFLTAREATAGPSHFYRVGGTTVCLTFAGEDLVPYITPALEHLRVPNIDHADLTLCVWDSRSTSTQMVPPPCTRESFTHRGDVWGFTSERIKFAFHWFDYSVNLMDHSTHTGIYWVPNAAALPYQAQAAPLRTLFHWWLERNGCQFFHAAAVGTDDGAVLLTGRGGTGKSTAALCCLRSGMQYLGDDYVAVRLEPDPVVYSLYCAVTLDADHTRRVPQLANFVRSPKLDRERAVIFLYPRFERHIVSEMPLKAIAMPRLTASAETTLTSAPGWKIQRATSFTTMSQLPYVGRHTHDFICRLCSALPSYTLNMGQDSNTIPPALSELLRTPPNSQHTHRTKPPADLDPLARPLVSVIIPVLNGERFIRDVVENVLAQDYPALELIIVDDGSTDRTAEIISRLPYDIRYLPQDNAGPASARNRGIREASGEFIAFLDVDDLWPANNLTRLVDEILLDPTLDVVHGYGQEMTESSDYQYLGNPAEDDDYHVSSAVYRKSIFAKVGLFDATLLFGEDNDWFARANESNAKIRRVEEVTLLIRRGHGQNMTAGKSLVELGTLKIFKKKLERKRARERRAEGPE